MSSNPTRRSVIGVLPAVAAAVPPGIVALMIARDARNVPYKDHWGHVLFILEAAQGVFKPSSLWEQINEHRIPLARLLQGLLAWSTRWDVRYEAYADFVLALAAFVALTALVARTVRPTAPLAAPWVVLAVSLLHFSLAQGYNWTWGAMMPAYLTTLAATTAAWGLARWNGGWAGAGWLIACAVAGALSFGAGLVLLGLVPVALLVTPPGALTRRRAAQATVAVAVGAALVTAYLIGWHARVGEPPPVFHPDRLLDYALYLLAYLGGSVGTREVYAAARWGGGALALLVAASGWLWVRSPATRRALAPWWLLVLYTLGNGVLAAYGRLDNGLNTAIFARYLPTVSLFMMSVAAVAALAIADLFRAQRHSGAVALAGVVLAVGLAGPTYYRAAQQGILIMDALDHQLAEGARCMRPDCVKASDACLLKVCWAAWVARFGCVPLQQARLGPFAE